MNDYVNFTFQLVQGCWKSHIEIHTENKAYESVG